MAGQAANGCQQSLGELVARKDCRRCAGTGMFQWSRTCQQCSGEGLWQCEHCNGRGMFACRQCGRGDFSVPKSLGKNNVGHEPARGFTLKRCAGVEETQIAKLWEERKSNWCSYEVTAVWSVSNPRLTWLYAQRRAELHKLLGRAPEELRGFHGTAPANVLSIVEQGFDAGRRAGQACGSGEYFAKDPEVSIGYCRGGSYMLVCQLCIGHQSTTEANLDGDHIWVPGFCYVISCPTQVLPLYVVRFTPGHGFGGAPNHEDDELASQLAKPMLFGGEVQDERLIDLSFASPACTLEAFPAAWWSGDLSAFKGELFFDPNNPHCTKPMLPDAVQGKVVLAQRGEGKFKEKVMHALKAGARALLVVQKPDGGQAIRMTGDFPASEELLSAAMLQAQAGTKLIGLVCGAAPPTLEKATRRGESENIPPNRPCAMTAESTDALWIGFLHSHFSDAQLTVDVHAFLQKHGVANGTSTVRIVRGKFTQAKVALKQALLRKEVHALNDKSFFECGTQRIITVDDAHGSPGQKCPRSIARYCRGQTLRFIDPCWCKHAPLPTHSASFRLDAIELHSAKGDEIASAFMQGAPFHDGNPQVTAIRAVHNEQLERQHEFYRQYLKQKNGEDPRQLELYHGTNVNILDTVYTHGLFPPSDMEASEECPVSGGKGLRTSLCTNDCKYCTKPHVWDCCHMYGLGIYLADLSQKSHRYVSAAVQRAGSRRECKMVICSVLLGDSLQLEGHLKCSNAMHDVQSLRALGSGDLRQKLDLVSDFAGKRPVDQRDILFVKGLQSQSRAGLSVVNSEFVSFHPYQCLPRYEITYLI